MTLHKPLPRSMRRIRLDAQALSRIVVPGHALELAESWEIEVDSEALENLPLPRLDLIDWLGCIHAHPHSDPSWSQYTFVTLALQAHHTFELMHAPGKVSSMSVRPGDLFAFQPENLHWLRADGDVGFLSLQWAIPRDDFREVYREIRRGLADAGLRSAKVPTALSSWKATIGEEWL
ncbi:cupin domain-containing protein [Pseudomonas mosselii]|uniref:hypothetical protein n=1 Tax=Pseudomonas mosselii TaxID=78327 RepID=UPI0021DA7C85|nr:hypothetical protein [Pseudomonas mosselii]MCU9529311.1 hypothetical protein [Pseudomonas mosselii]MCU9536602.1 hypothetical protein [Pseudomonas mosselii]MCU9542222.1 hypothetical protein [Pseudomonas mosselii]MCU9548327.1 hypothetical protein [Pseudomonas mosselii]